MELTRTEQLLEGLTDEGQFEKLAAAVLRDANPIYRSLTHPGVNVDGKTVKSPVDGIGFALGAKPPHMVLVHHTITARDGLEKKWLHDPATVKPKRGKPTAPPGDVRKAIEIATDQRAREPSLDVTLVLTTNREPDEALVRKMHAIAAQAEIELDLWTRSSLAHFLDNTAQGQWLRRQYLGEEPQRLSMPLLKHLSSKSIEAFNLPDSPKVWVMRDLDRMLAERRRPGVTFLVAASGLGKSTACYKVLSSYIAAGGAGLVISHGTIAASATLDNAIDLTLHELQSTLTRNAGSEALALCSTENPLLLVVEDINQSGQAAALAEKVAQWDRRAEDKDHGARPFVLICPLWPEVLGALREHARTAVVDRALYAGSFSPDEAREAVQRRARDKGRTVSDMDAEATAKALGFDPLLIALHDPRTRAASATVISDFVEGRIVQTATTRSDFPAAKYRLALRAFAASALKRRMLNPLWSELEKWSDLSDGDRMLLGHLAAAGDVIRLSGDSARQHIAYRHDRVRDQMLIDAAAVLVEQGNLPDEILAEPYYAEVIAGIVVGGICDEGFLSRIKQQNPLALFHALKGLRPESTTYQHVLRAIDDWIDTSLPPPELWRLRWEVMQALAQTEGPDVVRLVNRLGDRGWESMQARLRNGDISGGIDLCRAFEPGSWMSWRDVQIEHAKQKFGAALTSKVVEILRRPDLEEAARIGIVRLAGHIADSALGPALEACWQSDAARNDHLCDYLWAFAECCGSEPERFLQPVCDAWAALPANRTNDNRPSPRDELAAHDVRWAFRHWVPRNALPYFISRAADEELRWPITYMMEPLDDPVSIAFIIQEAAAMERRIEGTQSYAIFSGNIGRHWRDRQERDGVVMLPESRRVAEKLWVDPSTEKYVRRVAFRLWAGTRVDGDLQMLQRADLPSDLDVAILRERLHRGDRTAVPALFERINSGDKNADWWWYEVKHVWSDDLLPALDTALSRRAKKIEPKWQHGADTDYQTSDLLMRLAPSEAERLLTKYWDSLRYVSNFVHAALYAATPALRELVRTTMLECSEPAKQMEYIGQHIGLKTIGHPGITRPAQIAALAPYLQYLQRYEVSTLWDICNAHGWMSERKAMLDPYLREHGGILYVDDAPTFAALDELTSEKRIHWLDHWLDDYAKTGASSAERIECITRWFSARNTMSALRVMADALTMIGRRPDLVVLEAPVVDADGRLESIRANTTFAVKRRTLN